MGKIDLGNGRFVIVDDADIPIIADRLWHATKKRHAWVAVSTSYDESTGKKASVYMHRLITGARSGEYVDHKDGDGLNNCRHNLRRCSNGENARNKTRMNSRNTSGVHGVHWEKSCGKWRVRVCKDYNNRHIGVYDTIEDASAAYRAASLEIHGEFASPLGGGGSHR